MLQNLLFLSHEQWFKTKKFKRYVLLLSLSFIFLLVLTSPASAAYEVYTYGNGDFIASIFNSVKMLIGDNSYLALLKIAAIFTLLGFITQAAFGQIWSYQMFLGLVLILSVGYTAKVDVVINDVVEPSNTGVVIQNVPFAMGYTAYAASSIGYNLTSLMETAFSIPDGYKFAQTGFGYGVASSAQIPKIRLPQGPLQMTISSYIARCVMPEVMENKKNMKTLYTSTDLLTDIASTNQARHAMIYSQTKPQGGDAGDICADVYTNISGRMNISDPDYAAALNYSSVKLNAKSSTNQFFSDVNTLVDSVSTNIFKFTKDSTATINTIMISNLWVQALIDDAARTGATNTLSYLQRVQARAAEYQNNQMMMVGDLGKELVPMLRSMIEALLYAFFPIVLVMAMTPLMWSVSKSWAIHSIWIQLWGPMYAILNFMIFYYAQKKLSPITGSAGYGAGVSMQSLAEIQKVSNNILAQAGIISMSIPAIAYALIKGGDMAMSSVLSQVGSSAAHAASKGAGELTDGKLEYTDRSGVHHNLTGNAHTSNGARRSFGVSSNGTVSNTESNSISGRGVGDTRHIDEKRGLVSTNNAVANGNIGKAVSSDAVKGDTARVGAKSGEMADKIAETKQGSIEGEANALGTREKAEAFARQKTEKGLGEIAGFKETAEKYGTDVKSLAEGISQKDTTATFQAIDMLAKENGITYGQAASALGRATGDDVFGQYQQMRANAKARGFGEGDDALARNAMFEKNHILDEDSARAANIAAGFDGENGPYKAGMIAEKYGTTPDGKFMVTEAKSADGKGSVEVKDGLITSKSTSTMADGANVTDTVQTKTDGSFISANHKGSKADFNTDNNGKKISGWEVDKQGNHHKYDGNKETISGVVGKDNISMVAGAISGAGLKNVKAQEGQAFEIMRNSDTGKVATVGLNSGGSQKKEDTRFTESGSLSKQWRNFVQRTGGNQSVQHNSDTEEGWKKITNPQTGNPMDVYGSWQYKNEKGADGKNVRSLVGATFQNGERGDYLTFFKDDKGQVHYGEAKGMLDNNGKWTVGRMDSISEKEFERNGYSVKQKVDGHGDTLYTTATRGQEVKDVDSLKQDYTKTSNYNLAAGTFKEGQDLTDKTTDLQQGAMTGENALKQTSEKISQVTKLVTAQKNIGSTAGKVPTPTTPPAIDPYTGYRH